MSMSKTAARPAAHVSGLSHTEVEQSRIKHGTNSFTRQKRKSFFRKYLESFGDPIIKILLAALAVNVLIMFRTQNWFETAGIAAAVFLATFVSTLSEYGSESAFIRLQRESENQMCRVRRGGTLLAIPIGEVVVGDIVLLEAGEKIPADGILISGYLHVDQSAINGESAEAKKYPAAEEERWDPGVVNQLFRGTTVSSGDGVMLVRRVGDGTMYGSLARELQIDAVESPMKVRLAVLAKQISRLGYTAAALIAFADLFNAIVMDNHYVGAAIVAELRDLPLMAQNLMHAALLAISVIVVAVPEGLPMMITVVLSSNMMRMQRDNVMVRKLVGIETAGSINILFTDKTGTLTTGNLAVETVVSGDGNPYHSIGQLHVNPGLERLVALSCICNGTAALSEGKPLGGNSTERALLEFCAPLVPETAHVKKIKSVPFNSSKKYSWTRIDDGGELVLIKGAPEKLLPKCGGYYDRNGVRRTGIPDAVWKRLSDMTKNAVRVLLLATSDRDFDREDARLTLVALVGIRDKLRPEVRDAVETVTRAGIQTVMITGDNKETAVSIARDAGLLSGSPRELVLTGSELAEMSDAQLKDAIPSLRVVARALPTDKSRLVRLSQELGLVVGMTGDGVNDTAALKRADVGFAMGGGTEVAKDAGDIVILDNNFASITKAILYGRTIFHSIRKFIVFQLTMNFCAVGVSLLGPFIGVDTPVTVMQMLWINIIMDTLAGLAFAGEAPQAAYMEEKPKSRREPIVTRDMIEQILITGGYTILLCTAFLRLPVFRTAFDFAGDFTGFMTAFFTLFVFCGIFNAFNARTHRINLLANLRKNKSFILVMLFVSAVQLLLIFFGGTMFRTHALTFSAIREILLLAFTVIPFDLVRKILERLLTIRE
jgi:calcium-translocating P-type ATPase, PMCA-type